MCPRVLFLGGRLERLSGPAALDGAGAQRGEAVDGLLLLGNGICEGGQLLQHRLHRFCVVRGLGWRLVRLAAIVDNRGNQRLLPEKGAPAGVRSQ